MENEKRLIDAHELIRNHGSDVTNWDKPYAVFISSIENAPTVDAVETPDKEMLKALKILIKQYEHSKQSDYVHNPIAHAFYHTWKQLDEIGYGERKDNG